MSALQGVYTSESVSEGHPDKICDQISDRVLDAFLSLDSNARVACETFIADQRVIVAGEFRTVDPAHVVKVRDAVDAIVRQTLRQIGYGDANYDIDPDRCQVETLFNAQSQDIVAGTDIGDGVVGAGDQGVMVGYATRESDELMPLPIALAHRLMQRISAVRKSGALPFLKPDAKAQVSVRYTPNSLPAVETVIVSSQHAPDVSLAELREAIHEEVILPSIPLAHRGPRFRTVINPAGSFVTGGPKGDTGLTGRKIIVDSYGSACAHGGGAFSGKDATKVDRSGAYMARYLAKHVVAGGFAPRCTVQIAYAIGIPEPIALNVDVHGWGDIDEDALARALMSIFDLTPAGIIRELGLDRPIFKATSVFGHFGRAVSPCTWELTHRAGAIGAEYARLVQSSHVASATSVQ